MKTRNVSHGKVAGKEQKAKNFKHAIKSMIAYCKPMLFPILIAIFLTIVGTIFTLVGPNKLKDVTNLISQNVMLGSDTFNEIFNICIFLVCIYSAGALAQYAQGFIMAKVNQTVTKRMRTDISKKINKLPLRYFDKNTYGDVLSRVTNDVDTVGQTLNNSITMMVNAAVLFVGSMIMMFYTNWILAFASIAAVLIGFVLIIIIVKKSQKYFVRQQETLGKLNGHIEEIYSGHNVVKACNGEKKAIEVFNGLNMGLYTNAWKSQFLSGLMMPIMGFIGNLGYVVVCVVGAVLVSQGSATIGVITAFMIYVRLFTQPLSQFAQAMTNIQAMAAAGERVFEFLEEEEVADESHKTVRLTEVEGNVDFENVRFGYDEDKIIIKNFSASVKKGQKVAIVGPTGAGKTTLVNLLMRFYELNSGDIKIDGVSINDITRENIHDLFGMVLQDTWVFKGTVFENVAYSKVNATKEQVVEACKTAGIHYFVKTLPQGYDTILDDTASISQGQKQILTIARAMVENAPMLILDEATSSVDTRTEILIQQAMDKLTQNRTTFVIAHRLSTIKNADVIFVMKDGNIIEHGSHDQLMAMNGFYTELYNSQFSKDKRELIEA